MSKYKFFIFSDESGSWHKDSDIYVRSWIVIEEGHYLGLVNIIQEISSFLNSNNLRWKTLAGNDKYFKELAKIDCRIFITISSPADINWKKKYNLTKNFNTSIKSFDFGEMSDDLKSVIKKKIFDDIKNVLFLNYYERFHIENAVKRIERVIEPEEYDLVYRIDPPQMSKDGWSNILSKISNKRLEFPKSSKDPGIQFADIIAGCFKSLFLKDNRYNYAKLFFSYIKDKMVGKDKDLPNPNIIFFSEVNEELKRNIKEIWNL